MKFIFLVIFIFLSINLFAGTYETDKSSQAKEWLKNQPLAFIENKGQFTNSEGKPADNVLFKASYGDCDIYITTEGLSYVFLKYEKAKGKSTDTNDIRNRHGEKGMENKTVSYYRLDMNLPGAEISKTQIVKELAGKQGVTNYFFPNCPDGIYGVQEYGKITIKNIYKGIDWVIYTNAGNKKSPLKYDFVVHPQADYKDIRIKFLNAQSTQLTDNGTKLKIQTIAGNIEEGNLYSYQENSSEKKAIKTTYLTNADSTLAFEIGDYDKTKTLVIDPLVWATYYGGNDYEYAFSVCTDSDDNIYVSGVSPSIDFPLQPLAGAHWQAGPPIWSDVFILKFNDHGVRQWATFYGAAGNTISAIIAIDSQNNLYITGATYSFNFPTQGIPGSYLQSTQSGMLDLYIIKFNNKGQRQWATYYGTLYDEFPDAVGVDKQDHLYITAHAISLEFPVYELPGGYYQPHCGGEKDVIILRFSSQGHLQWATYYGGNMDEYSTAITFDSHNNMYISGLSSSKNFPVQTLTNAYNQTDLRGEANVFILKFNDSGQRLWATFYGGVSMDFGNSICVDKSDNIYVTGMTRSPDFPIQVLPGAYNQPTQLGVFDSFILKFDSSGQRQWATTFGGNDVDRAFSICSDNLNNIYILGETTSSDFPIQPIGNEYLQAKSKGSQDLFLTMFDKAGNMKWSTYYGSESDDFAAYLASDSKNSIYAVGVLGGANAYTIDYGNYAYYDQSWNEGFDGFIIKIKNCTTLKPTSIQTDRNNLCIHDNGTITLTAVGGLGDTLKWYTGGCGLNYIGKGTSLTIPCPIKNTTYYARWESTCDTSACDSILVTTYKEVMIFQNPVLCEGETYMVGSSVYVKTGIYRNYFKTITGCDSIVETHLVINPAKLIVQNKSICQGQTFTVGTNTYSASGTYTEKLKTYLKCDSTIITNLSVIPSKHTTRSKFICQGDSYIVGPYTHTTTGIYKDVLISASGCDSIVTTNLVVNPTKQTPYSPIICEGESVKVGPHIYTISGTYVDKLSTTFGCDSIVTTNLIVGTKKQNTVTRSICPGESFPVGDHTYTKTGTYTDILQTIYSCDSVVTTNLTVDPKIENLLIRSICEGENFPVGTHIYTTTGIYTNNLIAQSGCDSIVTTDLTVNPVPVVSLGDNTTICAGDTIVLSPGRSFNSYFWSDGSVLNDLIVTNPGIYKVTVYNDWCPASDEISINECSAELWFPNAFSPNYDGINDYFKPVIKGALRSFQLIIFNKWGQKIFESIDASTGWDGTFAGSQCPAGLYVYIANFAIGSEPTESKQKVKRGTVTLLK